MDETANINATGAAGAATGGVRILLRVCGARTEPLVVRGVTRAVRRILDLTGVSDLLVYE